MIIHLARHTVHLLCDVLVCLLREQSERSLEPMRQIACRRERAFHRPLAVFEQRVQIIDQRLDFGRIPTLDASLLSSANSHQPFPQQPEWCETVPRPPNTGGHENEAYGDRAGGVW